MSAVSPVPVTPRRKRAVSGADLGFFSPLTKPSASAEARSILGAQDVPELDWSETPRLNNDSPSTPSPPSTPSKVRSLDEDPYETPTRKIKEVRRVDRLQTYQLSTTTPQECIEGHPSKPGKKDNNTHLTFLSHLYNPSPTSAIRDAGIFWLARDNIRPKALDLLGFSEAPQSFTKADDEVVAAVRLALHNPLRVLRGHLEKRAKVKGEAVLTTQEAQKPAKAGPDAKRTTAFQKDIVRTRSPLHRQTPINTKAVPCGPLVGDVRTDSGLAGSTLKRFTRILSVDTIERLIANSDICVASLIRRPGERCSISIGSIRDIKPRTLCQLSELKDPLDLSACEGYLRELVNSLTCSEYHYKIAKLQLEALFDRYHDRRPRNAKNDHDFTTRDLESVRTWLKALTTLPEDQTLQQQQTTPRIIECTSTSYDQLGPIPDTDRRSSEQERDAIQSDSVKINIKVSIAQNAESNEPVINSLDLSHILRKTDASREDETIENTLATQTGGATNSIRDIREARALDITTHDIVKRGPSILFPTTSTTLATRQTSVTARAPTFDTKQKYETFSKFVSTQIVDINFMNALNMTSLAEERAKVSFVISLNAPLQQFCWYFHTLEYPVEHYIRELIYKKLSPQEENKKGFIYMYWIVGSFDFVKIGMTERDTTQRLREWKSKCGHEIKEHTSSIVGKKEKLPYVRRLEALVHAELREARLREPACKKCSERKGSNAGHIEWFAVSASHAQRVIEKWSDWISTEPYSEGKLKNDIDPTKIEKLCTPLLLSARDTAAFTTLKPVTQRMSLLPLASIPRRALRPRTRASQHHRT